MKWKFVTVSQLLLFAGASFAEPVPWVTDSGVGPNEVVYTVDLTCANPGFVCDQIDGYHEQDTSVVTGGATFELDDVADQIQFDSDSMQDVGGGLQPAYVTVTGTDLAFPTVPFAGVPEITDVLAFALSNPIIAVPGLDLLTLGDYPFSETITYSGMGTVFGDLEFILGPDIIVPPADILVRGTFRVLGDPDLDGLIEYELRDVTGTFTVQSATTILDEPVTVDVTGDMLLNLSGEVRVSGGGGARVPALGGLGTCLLALSLALAAAAGGFSRKRAPAARIF